MTDEQINAAIAEACGWVKVDAKVIRERNFAQWLLRDGQWWRHDENREIAQIDGLPNYCNDLNAMHEAEEVLLSGSGPGIWECFRNKLRCKYGEDDIHATARQRAEAFLRTLGKWEEDK